MNPTDHIQPEHKYELHNIVKDADTIFGQAAEKVATLLETTHRSFDQVHANIYNLHQDATQLVAETDAIAQTVGAEESVFRPSRQCVLTIGKLVSDLQYQDIIRQKLEHLQQINLLIKPVLEKATQAKQDASIEEALVLLSIIVQLQIFQLEQVEGEYQRVFRKIRETLADVKKNTLAAADTGITIVQLLSGEQATKAKATMIALSSQLEQRIARVENGMSPSSSFKNSVQEIKLHLKGLAKHLPPAQEQVSAQNQELLRQVEALYTMQSERETFRRIVFPKSGIISMRTGEGEVELF